MSTPKVSKVNVWRTVQKMKIDYVNFYNNFVNLCKEKGLKPSRAGIEAGIPKQTVSNWKAGRKPSDTYVAQLADYFGVPVSYFSEEAPETEKAPAPSKGTEVFMKMYDMLTPERQARLYETLSDLVKEQMQER
jgi:transcriptional regulator with XRE-family HTH domain|nr:MAG TPA: Helix-turn-helix XRE-family like protein [Caudoviricetes sp.]